MKNKIIAFCCIAIASFTSSCVKDNCKDITTTAPAAEVTALETYLSTNGIVATKDTRGFYFKIDTAGSEPHPSICANVTVKYNGKLTNGTQFDANTTGVTFALSSLIIGWQEAIPLIGRGGKITMYLPPSLAYGATGSGSSIPPNSNLIFVINLLDFN
jgi:FKBP-type peptidyl-prolyl cis-trans isomerase FkpA